jgi:PAS domain S-box-containing protein
MNHSSPGVRERDESPTAVRSLFDHNPSMFQLLFERSADAIWLFDPQAGVFMDCNPAAVELMRAGTKEKLLGARPEDLSPPLQADGTSSREKTAQVIALAEERGSHRFEWVARRFDGCEVPLEVSLTPICASGRNLHIVFSRDISQRKKNERELLELNQSLERRVAERTDELTTSEALFRAAFQGSPILSVIVRMSDQKYVLVNDAFVNWIGFAREELLGRTSSEFGIWESPDERDAAWADLRREGSIHEREYRFRNRRGDSTTVLISFEIIQINHVPHILAMGIDITRRKAAEEASRASAARLRESEARFSAAFRASPAFLGVLRLSDGKYVLANEAYLNWMGYAQNEVLGHSCLELGMWQNPADRDSLLNDINASGSIRERECRWRNRRGELFTILLSAEAIMLNDIPHMLLMALDITRRKQAEEEMQKALGREKELSELKSNFVSMVSHEFRTPLGIIQSSSELLRDFHEKMLPPERQEQLESISRNTRRMAGMMEEMLVLSRLDAGKLDFQPAALDLNSFCRRVVDEILSATNRRCPIELSLNSIPSDARADERLLSHIFTNLLSNAVKYSEPGATVHFLVERNGSDAVCVIRDQGIGIPEEDQRQLFEAFHRGSNVGTRPGTGLGLLLVKRCADLHGGKVQVVSKFGEGTTVTVRFSAF